MQDFKTLRHFDPSFVRRQSGAILTAVGYRYVKKRVDNPRSSMLALRILSRHLESLGYFYTDRAGFISASMRATFPANREKNLPR
jgi:hypothetical protein